MAPPARPEQKKKSSLKSSQAQYSDYSSPSRSGRPRETASDESNLEEYQIEGGYQSQSQASVPESLKAFPPTDIEREIQRKTPESDQHYRSVGVSSGNRR